MDNRGIDALTNQIIINAVTDYKAIVNKMRAGKYYSLNEYIRLKEFFLSDWFYALSWGLNGEYVLNLLNDGLEIEVDEVERTAFESGKRRNVMRAEAEQVVKLRDEDGLSYKDIGDILHRGAGTVYHIYSTMKKNAEAYR